MFTYPEPSWNSDRLSRRRPTAGRGGNAGLIPPSPLSRRTKHGFCRSGRPLIRGGQTGSRSCGGSQETLLCRIYRSTWIPPAREGWCPAARCCPISPATSPRGWVARCLPSGSSDWLRARGSGDIGTGADQLAAGGHRMMLPGLSVAHLLTRAFPRSSVTSMRRLYRSRCHAGGGAGGCHPGCPCPCSFENGAATTYALVAGDANKGQAIDLPGGQDPAIARTKHVHGAGRCGACCGRPAPERLCWPPPGSRLTAFDRHGRNMLKLDSGLLAADQWDVIWNQDVGLFSRDH